MAEKEESAIVILVVDDNDSNRELLSEFLASEGYQVLEARNGLEAVRLAIGSRPDLIIMDLSMPVMDGYVAVTLMREVPEISEVPIVACTAHDTSTHREQAMRIGFNEFLPKPIDLDQLDFVIDRFLKAA